ncbi:hypothetical protein E1B28_007567 [Marasmius oreades]|nr:uncharacterized protein E1B28_007567 [Marasmius oreades]KAG7093933.1 hypothetical protein E1B28_007567 [Marasmius oreades]
MNIQIWSDTSLVDTDTRLRSQAYEEKVERSKRKGVRMAEKLRKNLRKHGRGPTEGSDGEEYPPPRNGSVRASTSSTRAPAVASRASGSAPSSVGQNRPSFSIGRGTTTRDRRTPQTAQPRSSRQSVHPPPANTPACLVQSPESDGEEFIPKDMIDWSARTYPTSKGKQREVQYCETEPYRSISKGKQKACPQPQPSRIRSATEQNTLKPVRKIAPLPARRQGASRNSSSARLSERDALSAQWTQMAKLSGAATISFMNEVDDEEIPPLDGFCYLEKDFNYDEIEHSGRDLKEVFLYCDHRICEYAEECNCQSTQEDIRFTYDEYRHFIANEEDNDVSPFVVECNEYCACDKNCRNRVAQLPRKVPIEIFKTRKCGWGARSSVDVEKGTVLGLYTGKIIYRRDAELLKGEAKSFCFDMDGRESPDEEPSEESYTVDAKACGNWTRFLNHSCAANIKVYSAVWWTIPESNLPCLVYYAAADIPARTEFTVDYNPSQARLHKANASKGKKKGKGKNKIPEGAIPCECGTKVCRGWVTEACDN